MVTVLPFFLLIVIRVNPDSLHNLQRCYLMKPTITDLFLLFLFFIIFIGDDINKIM